MEIVNGEKNLLKAIRQLNIDKSFLKQTMVYPNISMDSIDLVRNDFPEFDPTKEIPLLFCKGYWEDYDTRWLFISSRRLYYRVAYSPSVLTALDCITLERVQSFKLHTFWVQNSVELNGTKIGKIIISSVKETHFLNRVIKVILSYFDTTELRILNESPQLSYFPACEWQHLENASLFKLVNDYFSEHNHGGRLWGFYDFYTHPFIKPEKMELAIEVYADYNPDEEVPLLFVEEADPRIAGMVITNKGVYYNLWPSLGQPPKKGKLTLDKLTSFKVKSKIWGYIYINRQRRGMTTAFDFLDREAGRVFERLMNLIIEEVHKK